MFDFCVTVEVGSFNVVRLVTTPLSSLLSGYYLHFSPKSCMTKKSNGNKYKKQIEEASMDGCAKKGSQTKRSRENNRQGEGVPCLLFSLLLLFVYFFAQPSILASSI